MSAAWAIIWFIIILFFLILIHELGHFVTAKWRGVKVLEFGMGIPPRIWAWRRGETEYSINALPLGGFCKMLGEEDPSEPRSLASQSAGTRLLVLSAGSLVMLLFPIVLYTIAFMVPHNEIIGEEGIEIRQLVEDAPGYNAGLMKEDEILSMNGEPVETFDELKEITNANLGKEITMVVLRESEQVELTMVPRKEYPDDEGPLGIGMGYARSIKEKKSYPPWTAFWEGIKQSWEMVTAMNEFVIDAIEGDVEFKLTGVVGAGQATTEVASEYGAWALPDLAALLSINLGIINLLPIPALDGGRIIFVLLEVGRGGRRVSARTEGMIHMVGFMILIALMVALAYWDILRIIDGESLLP